MALQRIPISSEGFIGGSTHSIDLPATLLPGDIVLFYTRNETSVDPISIIPAPDYRTTLNSGTQTMGYYLISAPISLITISQPGSQLYTFINAFRDAAGGTITGLDPRSWDRSIIATTMHYTWDLNQFPPFSMSVTDERGWAQIAMVTNAGGASFPVVTVDGEGEIGNSMQVGLFPTIKYTFATAYSARNNSGPFPADTTITNTTTDAAIVVDQGFGVKVTVTPPVPQTGGGLLTSRARKTQYNNLPYEVSSAMLRRR